MRIINESKLARRCGGCGRALREFNRSGYCTGCAEDRFRNSDEGKIKRRGWEKKWRENNRDKIKEKWKRYRTKNREEINRRAREKYKTKKLNYENG